MKSQLPVDTNKNRANTNDRRQKKTVPRIWYLFFGSRKNVRRLDDNHTSYFLDHFSLKVFIIIISVVLLSVIDAILTLFLIRKGVAAEGNPIMAQYLKYGPLPFLAAKYLLTTTSVVLLLIYKNFYLFRTKFRAKYLFIVFFAIYASVVIWELYLIYTTLD
jgi:hypothetical protein